jgi:hypothetical protein
MYYLAIENLGIEKCINRNPDDIYENDQYYSCLPDLFFVRNKIVKSIKIRCIEIPETIFNATVYSD